MTELTEFLTARLDEREALARAAHPGRWRLTHRRKDHGDGSHSEAYGIDSDTAVSMPLTTRGEMWDVETVVWIAEDRDYGYPEPGIDRRENAECIADNNPAYVLADIAAKRRIIEFYIREDDISGGHPYCAWCQPWDNDGNQSSYQPGDWPCDHLKLLALPFADHPDYREEWRP